MRMMEGRRETYDPVFLGVSSVLLSATTNSNPFGARGFNQLWLEFDITWGAATVLSFYIATRTDGTTNWKRTGIEVATSAAGVSDIQQRQFSYTVVSTSPGIVIPLAICADQIRIESITATAATTDRVSLYAHVGIV